MGSNNIIAVSQLTKRTNYLTWEEYFMSIAFLSAQRSKDPRTQVGACIVSEDKKVVGIGYNGMPIGCDDDSMPWNRASDESPEQWLKSKSPYVCHAELNAVLNKNLANIKGCTIYVALFPCNMCAQIIIQSGIKEVVFYSDKYHDDPKFEASRRLLDTAKIKYRQFHPRQSKVVIDFSIIESTQKEINTRGVINTCDNIQSEERTANGVSKTYIKTEEVIADSVNEADDHMRSEEVIANEINDVLNHIKSGEIIANGFNKAQDHIKSGEVITNGIKEAYNQTKSEEIKANGVVKTSDTVVTNGVSKNCAITKRELTTNNNNMDTSRKNSSFDEYLEQQQFQHLPHTRPRVHVIPVQVEQAVQVDQANETMELNFAIISLLLIAAVAFFSWFLSHYKLVVTS
ncbi:uncharacterized protein LOC131952263 isoform X2 [Physella acuta]|uniref:uncharacterized protein LOC131952263 isoform X2 n=1 Tax=Physella acuta TaxID=109671 RepID=UPI0027DD2D0C|nr:uncharacterized protein LOC131952263 isoform X2 [Physella acuta]